MESPDIQTCIEEAEKLEKMYMDLLDGTNQRRMKRIDDGSTGMQNVEYRICVINSKNELLQSTLLEKYNLWYEDSKQLIRKYAGHIRNDKYESFTGLYDRIVSLINLEDTIRKSNERNHLRKEFIACFDSQVSLLHSIEPLVVSSINNQKRHATAEVVNSQLKDAEILYEQGSLHSAGIFAINAFEIYLHSLCEENDIESADYDSVLTMAQKLHESVKGNDFDLEMLRTIEHLVSVGKKCLNTDEETQEDEVRKLIDRITEITFLAFC
ncbi:MAG: hypothetical protein PWQ51_2501 [Methanolobus sp.]|jgi:HEPN domain-containing protein|uniref:hypothetical protein n=1 Tax=Methanolobus sp. TaxID=1874737 RepID=UPI0024AC14A2|nr:hypothetical protein [Methanolobus sp.]MDI3484877.1 hypothetical protein [Methanolobus sp.]MDK2831251.1 hypothetical protein [Methanolobus sp.]MDK2940336.1 hypothetical protein [Methanolobus sp.]